MAMEVRDSLEIAHTAEDFSKLYAGIAILWLHQSLNQPSVVYCFFFFASVFVQSHVRAHVELMWLLSSATPIGWLNRMIQFKEQSRKAVRF
ncbi:hypothetical protein J1N35_023153 [Gossypium stocksii]|uniref:Uncharacterized protein n=1 Tax=Gossypium stocksii TaxID=47602 RepID=A0A9D4A3F4_9ROSI|nr:hypothetical protein J1N35_023153 [Gossypium stocksii]